MAVLGQWDSGTLPTTVGSGVSSAPTDSWSGGPAIQFDQQSGSISQVRFQFTSGQNVAVRAYLQMPSSWPSSSMALIIARPNSTSNIGQAVIAGTGAPGQLRLLKADPSANAATSSNGMVTTSTWYRFEFRLDQVNGRGRLGVFPLASDTPVWDSGWATNDFGSSVYRVEIGPAYTSTTIGTVRAANIVVTDDPSDWIGRATGDNLSGSEPEILGQWDSGALPNTVGSGVSYVADGGWDGQPAIQFDQQSGSISQVRFQFNPVVDIAMRAYIQMPNSWIAMMMPLIIARSDASTMTGRTNIAGSGNPGQVRLVDSDGGTTVASSSNGLVAVDQWYRFELQFDGTLGQGRTAVFALGSDTALWDSGWQTDDFSTPAYRAEFGPAWAGATLGQIRMTHLLVTNDISDWIGRHPTDTSGGGDPDPESPDSPIALWNAAEAQGGALLGVWNGTDVDLIETGTEIWLWHYDWTNDEWTTPPSTRPTPYITRVLASGPTAPLTNTYPSWMGENPTDWAEGKAVVHFIEAEGN